MYRSSLLVAAARRQAGSASAAPLLRARPLSLLASDQTTPEFYAYHKTHWIMLGLVPTAFLVPSSSLTMPLDLLLAILAPIHGHIGMNWIITDYVPPNAQAGARAGMMGLTLLAMAGLVKLSLDTDGPGLVGSVKSLWTSPPAAQAAASKKH
jgi:succinate dehydrogenase (ubiquinone) membrane anchor subunit